VSSMTVVDSLRSSVKIVSCAGVAETKSGEWPLAGAAHSTRPCLEGRAIKYPTRCSLLTYPSFTLHVTHTLAHTYQFPFSP